MADVSNRDEAERCKQMARNALAASDTAKALKLLEKAKRMCPSDASIDGLVAQVRSGGCANSGNGGGGSGGTSAGVRHRSAASASSERPTSDAGTRSGKNGDYTADQMRLAQRVLRTKDYYDILEVDRGASEDTLKKAYRKLALKLHPDKNRAPGAEEAFKKLSKVWQCLSDEDKREAYNRYGDEERMPQQHHHHAHHQDFMDEFFSNLFSGPRGPHGPRGPRGQNGAAERASVFQLLPVLFVLLCMFSGNFGRSSSANLYSWTRSAQYHVERSTATLNVAYFVTESFEDSYAEGTHALAEFDQMIEIYHVRNLISRCESQTMSYKRARLASRRFGASDEDDELAQRHPRPACKQVEKIKRKHRGIYQDAFYR